MTTFSRHLKDTAAVARKPGRVIELPLSAWAEAGRPSAPMPMGIVIPPEAVEQRIDREAEQEAIMLAAGLDRDAYVRFYNRAVTRDLLHAATCVAIDVSLPFFATPLELLERLTAEGVERLMDELAALRKAESPAMPEIDDAGASHLDAMLIRGVGWDYMTPDEVRETRRLLEHCRQSLARAEEIAESKGAILAAG